MNTSQWQVLIVEDEDDSLQMVSKILQHHQIHVHIARNGQQCIDMLKQVDPTLVIMDLAMPEMDGWETLIQMRSDPNTAHIPVVAITAYHSANVAQDAMAAGFDAYFPKPLDDVRFLRAVEDIVGHAG